MRVTSLVPPWLPKVARPVGHLAPLVGPVRRPADLVEVLAEVEWTDGATPTVRGWARAWTRDAVFVEWYGPGWRHWMVWLPVSDVGRRDRAGTLAQRSAG